MNEDEAKALCDRIRQIAFDIHVYHGHGHLEKVYENALAHRLKKMGLKVEQQVPLQVFDEDGTLIGDYFADLITKKQAVRTKNFLFDIFRVCKGLIIDLQVSYLGKAKCPRLSMATTNHIPNTIFIE